MTQSRYDFAQTLIREAGALALGYFRDLPSLTVKNKGPQDVVSEPDLLSLYHRLRCPRIEKSKYRGDEYYEKNKK